MHPNLAVFLPAVVRHLRGPWRVDELQGPAWGRLADDEGRGIVVRLERGRLSFVGILPRGAGGTLHWPRDVTPPRITVSAERPAVQVARELERRLLPPYEDARQQVLEHLRAHDQRCDATTATTAELQRLLGADAHDITTSQAGIYRRLHWYRPHTSATFDVGPTSVDVDLRRLSPELAQRVAQLLTETA